MTGELMGERELVEVWERGLARGTWTRVLNQAVAEGAEGTADLARRELDGLPHPLAALAASAELVRLLQGCRWLVILDALTGGATWDQIAAALDSTPDVVRAEYREAIALQEQHGGDAHDTERARAVLADEPALPAAAAAVPSEKDTPGLAAGGGVHSETGTPAVPTPGEIPSGLAAVEAMERHAGLVATVARRILAGAAAAGLPELLSVRPEVYRDQVRLALQPYTIADARAWAAHLGIELTVALVDASDYRPGEGDERADGRRSVDGVTVMLGALRWIPAAEWAAMQAQAGQVDASLAHVDAFLEHARPAAPATVVGGGAS
ncbi:hypothetical protein ACWEFL_15925 [Streptomyces sp. NPDC004838]